MTIEQAIAYIKNPIGKNFEAHAEFAHAEFERAAIAALKEQQERERGCEHCRGWDKRCGANYCPMCGRKLGENNG